MNAIAKISAALAGSTGVAVGGVFVHKLVHKDVKTNTISKNIKFEYLLTKDQTEKWNHRVNLLKSAGENSLSSDLLSRKKEKSNFSSEDLKKWCSESLESEFMGVEDKKFQNVKLYCGINIGDRINGTKVSSNTQDGNEGLKTKFSSLKGKEQGQLVKELFSIKDTANAESTWSGNKALKEWCLKALDTAFEEGLIYDNAKDYCVITG
ncbi:hypothetical protein MHC_03835 [Mycoplasma haemocanis str. Illinois]|uniref:Uncharacterized protein n=1 Tax=Mycoplasma haemocanis (strain Illinois) TaxID=1111676 RepID=H6N7K5_MYCHN|nr:hypothetical protein [Mycoplasma haemocanis]AEW45627.1 hypothetical protein MHC_03835 [Mycoplasma haemocanis str. Illinois]